MSISGVSLIPSSTSCDKYDDNFGEEDAIPMFETNDGETRFRSPSLDSSYTTSPPPSPALLPAVQVIEHAPNVTEARSEFIIDMVVNELDLLIPGGSLESYLTPSTQSLSSVLHWDASPCDDGISMHARMRHKDDVLLESIRRQFSIVGRVSRWLRQAVFQKVSTKYRLLLFSFD